MKIETNAPHVALRFKGAAGQIKRELAESLAWLAPRVAASMRVNATKFRSTLTNSIEADRVSGLEYVVRPKVAYAINVEKGRKPGKGLPRFFDPAAGAAVAWLESRISGASLAANPKFRPGRVGSKRRNAAEIELRNRYMAWSRHVRLHGIKPHPFVKPTADEWRQLAPATLRAALRRGIAGAGVGLDEYTLT